MKALNGIITLGFIAIAIAIVTSVSAMSFKEVAETATNKYDELKDQAQSNFESYNIIKAVNTKNVIQIDTLTNDIARLNNNLHNLNTDVERLTGDADAQHITIKAQAKQILILQKHARVYFKGVDSLRTEVKTSKAKNNKTLNDNAQLKVQYKKLHNQLDQTKAALNIAHKKEADRTVYCGN